jgi:flagellar basal-body rod protein FlgF
MMFTDYVVKEGDNRKIAFAQDIASYRDTTNGPMKATGNPFDVAVSGPGFIPVETAAGERYTRAGNFTVTNDGTLVTAIGQPVLGADGARIVIDQTDRDVKIGENGLITVRGIDGGIEERGQIGVVEFADAQELKRIGDQLFETNQAPQEAATSRLLQGTLEMSNVEPVKELVRVTELSRSTSSAAKFIEVMYELQRKTSNTYAQQSQ